MVQVLYHPGFADPFEQLAHLAETSDPFMELFGEISALLRALEDYGHAIEGDQPEDASHPIYSSKFQTFALRRTPPTNYTPHANTPPVVRIPYVWFDVAGGGEVAIVMLLGDKTKPATTGIHPSFNGSTTTSSLNGKPAIRNTPRESGDNDDQQQPIGHPGWQRHLQRRRLGNRHRTSQHNPEASAR